MKEIDNIVTGTNMKGRVPNHVLISSKKISLRAYLIILYQNSRVYNVKQLTYRYSSYDYPP